MTATGQTPSAGHSPADASKPTTWWQWWLMYPALGVAILGAIPTVINGVRALSLGLPYSEVPQATKNADLFAKNFDCLKKTGPSVELKDNTEVQAVICDNGDIWIRVTTADKLSGIVWVSPADIAPRKHAGLIVGEAVAAPSRREVAADSPVLCVFRDRSGKIVRKIAVAPGRCQDQQIDPYTGAVTSVPADCACPR
jgi:hypothetical protein